MNGEYLLCSHNGLSVSLLRKTHQEFATTQMDPGGFMLSKVSHFCRTITVRFSEVIVRIRLVLQEHGMNRGC